MKNRWTGGQYSIFRAVFALFLLVHFLQSLRRDAQNPLLLTAGVVLTILFGIGLYDRAAALGLWCIWTYLFGCDPRSDSTNLPLAGWLLLAHLLVPRAPYGSWAARGRVDPGGGWRMPPALFAAVWIALALSYASSGSIKLLTPSWREGAALGAWSIVVLELSFAPLALLSRVRPWLWMLTLLMELARLVLTRSADPSLGLVMMHFFTWDPGWVRPLHAATERVFYDGHCGLCQRSVRLILAEDVTGTAFRFAPLQGETFQALLSPEERAALPLSLVVQTEKGTLLTRSAGVLHILRRLGGLWRVLAGFLVLLPIPVRNALYDGVARIRLHLFAPPPEMCPLMTPQLRARFDP